jgi:hypothetical protein
MFLGGHALGGHAKIHTCVVLPLRDVHAFSPFFEEKVFTGQGHAETDLD